MDINDAKYIAKIQRFYDVLYYKKIDAENTAMISDSEERKCTIEKIEIFGDLMNEYDNIFKEFLYKDKS